MGKQAQLAQTMESDGGEVESATVPAWSIELAEEWRDVGLTRGLHYHGLFVCGGKMDRAGDRTTTTSKSTGCLRGPVI